MIKKLEQISYNAWPSLKTLVYDGWIVRLSDGITRRANSINPLFESTIDAGVKIDFCEELYRAHGLPVIFKITPQATPSNLDAILEQRGYLYEAEASVQTIQLENMRFKYASDDVQIMRSLTDSWLHTFLAFNGYSSERKQGFENIMNTIVLKAGYLHFIVKGQSIGCGLGVIDGDFIGLFDLVITPECRGQGYGKQVVESLLHWGKMNGCTTAYLQVMTNNTAAQNLYRKVAFKEVYKYWYRVKE